MAQTLPVGVARITEVVRANGREYWNVVMRDGTARTIEAPTNHQVAQAIVARVK